MSESRPRIIVSNDDSYLSQGLYLLYEAVRGLGEARIYSTEWPRSAVGHSVSFNRPLRLSETSLMGYKVYVTDGSPIDVLHLAVAAHGFRPDLVVSGVNVGENLSIQHIAYSGTIAVAREAALLGIPAIAFSADVNLFEEFRDERLRRTVLTVAGLLAEEVLRHGMPRGVDLISVNIPSPHIMKGCVRVTRAARRRWEPGFEKRIDTRGRPYYWLTPKTLKLEPGTDAHAVLAEGCVSITPLTVDINTQPGSLRDPMLLRVAGEAEAALEKNGSR